MIRKRIETLRQSLRNIIRSIKCKNQSFSFLISLFYEQCLEIKKTMFPEKHLAKLANIATLYQESLRLCIGTEEFRSFISS